MKNPQKPPKYSAEQISEITNRIAALRTRWLGLVETHLASQQNRAVRERNKLSAERAE